MACQEAFADPMEETLLRQRLLLRHPYGSSASFELPMDSRVPKRGYVVGARREDRTPTLLREPDFESGASASSAIRATAFEQASEPLLT